MKKIGLLVCIGLTACQTVRVGDFTTISTKNINLNSSQLVVGQRVKGEDKSFGIINMKEAVDNAIQQNRCAVGLSDVALRLEQGFFTHSYIAEGNLILDRSLPGCQSAAK